MRSPDIADRAARRREAARTLLSGALLASAALADPAGSLAAQQGLERWLEDLVPRSFEVDGRPAPLPAALRIEPVPAAGVSGSVLVHHSGLGPYSLLQRRATLEIAQPLASTGLTLDAAFRHRLDSGLDLGTGAVRRAAPSDLEIGLTGLRAGRLGRWAARLAGRRSGGSGWAASVGSASRAHRLVATYREGPDAGLRLTLPEEDVEGRSPTSSSRSGIAAEVRWPAGRWAGTGVAVRWSREDFDPRGDGRGSMLEAAVAGVRDAWGAEVRLRPLRALALSGGYDRSRVGADGALARDGQRAGRLFFGHLRSERWRVSFSDPTPGSGWRTTLERGRADGSLSARLETWPFRGVWDQLGAVAYRVRGEITTRWAGGTFTRRRGSRRGWTVAARRLRLGLEGEDWLVTGLGFGRSDRRALEDFRATVLLLGGGLDLPVPRTGDRAALHVSGSIPVQASWNRAMHDGSSLSSWIGGWSRWTRATIALSWSGTR